MRISDLMTTDVITVGPDTSLKEAARRMLEAGVSGLPVTDADDNLLGIITEADFVASEAERRVKERAGLLRFFTGQHDLPDHELKVGDVMTTELIVISPDEDHADAARLMERERVKRLPVVDDGKLVGLVSRTDMLRAFTRPDQEIIDEINDHVMREVLWIDPRRVTVESVDGNIVLRGKLETRTDANLLVELTKRLDGVASVADQLDWEVDNTKTEMTSPPPNFPRGNWVSR
jgi:CBS-domain-containing membrane protein